MSVIPWDEEPPELFNLKRRRRFDAVADSVCVLIVTMTQPLLAAHRCHYCGRHADTRDHVVPQAEGGLSHWWNLVASCFDCNQQKGHNFPTCCCAFCDRAKWLWLIGHSQVPAKITILGGTA